MSRSCLQWLYIIPQTATIKQYKLVNHEFTLEVIDQFKRCFEKPCVLENKKKYSLTKIDYSLQFFQLDSPIHFIQDIFKDTFFIHINPSVVMRDQGVDKSLDCFFP